MIPANQPRNITARFSGGPMDGVEIILAVFSFVYRVPEHELPPVQSRDVPARGVARYEPFNYVFARIAADGVYEYEVQWV